jgi:carbamoyl-phosphate synthase large subunit
MPKRTDIHSILIIGSGPIVIGQGCEFDYSGVQACRALKEEGYRIVLINSNPATIMTDPEFADATYIEPITPEAVEKILAREAKNGTPVDAVLPTLGGQTGLNTAMACYDRGIFTKYNVKMIGANRDAIHRGEDRQVFKDLMIQIGLKVPRSGVVHTLEEARKVLADIGLPLIIRPAFTLGGTGGGIAYNVEEFETIVGRGLDASPVTEVLIEQSVIGWKEFEMEVMRDKNDNVVIICSIENLDPMGVHTGDSITVAPIQTLTDKEYQRMRDASIAVIRAVGVETGGSNIQFAINPENGDMIVVEMNPRVSRSSALASKATGYPIAKLAAKLAVGYTLDELPNYITSRRSPLTPSTGTPLTPSPGTPGEGRGGGSVASLVSSSSSAVRFEPPPQPSPGVPGEGVRGVPPEGEKPSAGWDLYTSACFEPSIDYCVIKIPRWTFEKFPDADETLTTQMKSVGEAMAIGRTFKEALQKGIRSMEVKRFGFGLDKYDKWLNAQKKGTEGQRDQGTKGRALPVTARSADGNDEDDKTVQGESQGGQWPIPVDKLRRKLAVPSQGRLYYIRYAMKMGWTNEEIYSLTHIDPWFLGQMRELVDFEAEIISSDANHETLRKAKELGYSDVQLAIATRSSPRIIRRARETGGAKSLELSVGGGGALEARVAWDKFPPIKPVYKLVDTCAAEFEAATPYYYSTYETPYTVDGQAVTEDEIRPTDRPKVIIIGGGPNRIGQGIEFDYCCVQAAFAMRELNIESVMINSNPETVSTDYDTSDLLFFEPLTHEDILNICERLNGGVFVGPARRADSEDAARSAGPTKNLVKGVIVQFGGQTPLNLARGLKDAGVPILGTTVESLDAAGDREQFRELLQKLGLRQPANGIARSVTEARQIAKEIGYPVLVRPSFVLGGRAMEIVSDENQLNYYMTHAVEASTIADAPILVDKFLDNATEVDVDCIADFDPAGDEGEGRAMVIGVMEHIEEAGIHSGDSACSLPPYSLPPNIVAELKRQTRELARELRVRGLMNVQYAVKDGDIYVIEVNPRASRTVPFVSKAQGQPFAKIAAKVMAGKSLKELGFVEPTPPKHTSVKESVFPFTKFPGVDVILGPEMRSTGEVMGIDDNFPLAFAKSQIAAGTLLTTKGTVFISVRDADKEAVIPAAKILADGGFEIIASEGTHKALTTHGIKATRIPKLSEGRPNIADYIKNKKVHLIINTPTKKGPQTDEGKIRSMAVLNKVPILTTITAANAAVRAIQAMQQGDWDVRPLQDYFAK